MKNIFLLSLILIFATSCQKEKISELNNRISELENLNKQLIDSLNRQDYMKVISTELIGIPEKNNLIPNQPNRYMFLLPTIEKFPEYNVYRITKNGNEKVRELLYENYKESRFEFNFIPKNKNDKSLSRVSKMCGYIVDFLCIVVAVIYVYFKRQEVEAKYNESIMS